ncbi:MAG: ribosome recycling factor [Candidatus Gracilibacteria bacterium]|nr:ribosome recycling factor [Candidatus Gracilibacteria bacterium]
MFNQILSSARGKMDGAVTHLKTEFASLQVGRANPAMVENIMIDSYGTKTPLKNLATINAPDPSMISIQPWDRSILGSVEKAINESGLGFNAQNDGVLIRIPIAKPSEEKRKELTKLVSKYGEDARISIRTARQDAHNEAKRSKESGTFTEDDFFRMDKEIQKIVDDYNEKVDKLAQEKEAEIMTV